MKISFVGAGNVAWHLAKAMDKQNQTIVEVYSRNIKNAARLCEKLYHTKATTNLDFTNSVADIFIIAVPDDCIEMVVNECQFPENSTVVHTSGTVPLHVLANIDNCKTGVFYPLQTFSKSKELDMKKIPICLEASDIITEKLLEKLAFKICENVCFYNSDDRKTLHLAAVFACNFTNHLLTLSKKILINEGLEFSLIKPLITETLEKALQIEPENSQTGPASRHDHKIIAQHLKMLAYSESLSTIYSAITESILDKNNGKR